MAKLILSENMHILDEFPLDRDCITIGRRSDNDIRIEDRAVSGYHCQIITVLNDSFLEDLQSTNGTYVNSKRISKQPLRNGDLIILGTHQLRYENDLAAGDDAEPDTTALISPPPPRPASGGEPSPAPTDGSSAAAAQARIKVLNGTNKDRLFPLTRTITTLGKSGQQVAAIARRGDKYVIISIEADRHNRYATVNDTPLTTQPTDLGEGDLIQVNGIRMSFHLGQ